MSMQADEFQKAFSISKDNARNFSIPKCLNRLRPSIHNLKINDTSLCPRKTVLFRHSLFHATFLRRPCG